MPVRRASPLAGKRPNSECLELSVHVVTTHTTVPPIECSSSVHPVSSHTAGRPSERAVTHIGGPGSAVSGHTRSQTRDSQAINGNQWTAEKPGDAHLESQPSFLQPCVYRSWPCA